MPLFFRYIRGVKKERPNRNYQNFFDDVYCKYVRRIETFVYYYVYDRDLAEEITQEVFASFWENIENIDPEGNVLSYLLQSAKNASLKHFRKLSYGKNYSEQTVRINSEISAASMDAFPFYDVSLDEINRLLKNAYEIMPEKTREAFRLNRIYGKKYDEIAALQGVSVKNIEYRMMSALKVLRSMFRDYMHLLVIIIGTFFGGR